MTRDELVKLVKGGELIDAMDISGNIASCQTTITVIYETPPNPTVTPGDIVLCNGESPEIELDNSFQNIKFVWSVSASSEVSGFNPLDSTFGAFPFTISENIYNSSDNAQPVDYTFTIYPYSGNGPGSAICANGYDQTIRIWVNPTPGITADAPDMICNDDAFDLR